MLKVLVFGSPIVEEDKLALEVAEKIDMKGVEFMAERDPLKILATCTDKSYLLMDVAYGIKEVTVIDDPDKINFRKSTTAHDMDLNFFIKLFQETGQLKKIKIIAIPVGYDVEKATKEVKNLLRNL